MEEAQRANQEYEEARDEMKDALVQKLSYKFGRGGAKDDDQVSLASAAIRNEVDGMLIGAAAPVTQANLRRLDQRLMRKVQGQPVDNDLMSVRTISSYTAGGSSMPRNIQGPSGSLSARDSRPVTPAMSTSLQGSGRGSARGSGSGRFAIGRVGRACVDPAVSAQASAKQRSGQAPVQQVDVDWSTLDRLAAKLHEKDSELQRSRGLRLQDRLKEDLDKQIVDFQLKQAREKQEDADYYDKYIAVNGNWQDQDKEKSAKAKEKALKLQKERDEQIQSDRARKEAERRRVKAEAEELVQNVKNANEKDKQETEQRRLTRKERVRTALQDSSNAKAQREEEMKSKIDHEEALLDQYRQRISDREKKAQEDTWQKVVVRRQMIESAASAKHDAAKQKEAEVEATAARERAEKDAQDMEREKKKRDNLNDKRRQIQEYQVEQMRRKLDAKEEEREYKKGMGYTLEVDARKFNDLEASRIESKKQRALEHRAELERQIAMKMNSPGKVKRDCMSASELAMNKKLLERVERLQYEGGDLASSMRS